jgi:AraC-like DNA-binding protein
MYYFIHHQAPRETEKPYPLLQKLGYIRHYQLQICVVQVSLYLVQIFQLLGKYLTIHRALRINLGEIKWWFVFNVLLLLLIVVTIAVKLSYDRDLGDHIIAAFFTVIIYVGMIRELIKSMIPVKKTGSVTSAKSETSFTVDPRKAEILEKLNKLITQKIYSDSLISVTKIGKLTGEPPYLVSQVINEQLQMTFYDWIAFHRIEEAKQILRIETTRNLTIEDIAERVGYNSKSAFNKAFKKYTGKTPSEVRSES